MNNVRTVKRLYLSVGGGLATAKFGESILYDEPATGLRQSVHG
jgi:hypothetical protein